MPIGEGLKKRATDMANKVVAKAENIKAEKQLTGDGQIAELEKKIAALKEVGGFENTIKRLEAQIVQIRNKKRNLRK